jgi:hypothetical protein
MFKIAAMLGALVIGATALSGPAVAENPVTPKVQLQAVAAAFPTGWGSLTKANGVNSNPCLRRHDCKHPHQPNPGRETTRTWPRSSWAGP